MFGMSSKLLDAYLNCFNHDNQLGILQEECAELIQAVSKVKRGKRDALANLKEEIAHVAMTSAMVAKIYNITEKDILTEIKKKADKYNFDI